MDCREARMYLDMLPDVNQEMREYLIQYVSKRHINAGATSGRPKVACWACHEYKLSKENPAGQ
ncbi:MAG: hypothetical protein A2941_01615 [Candidatus Yanofskybacteria bacterium RIFCSPLOWO2_01_FULL_49_17]|uniref:Uncharacterized protein n=1 Tax=Candidatus Yanofskybacteria bacterium RIFCSPLOWO2_01_FULL_49_17 TaxID=1802700 RepID=A0A1F8GQE5_9BACT|nr:MAG: hypothetical protein A2941_01615 [Candidatus Yanofskybacteria bacterium RIFCSPLOWO2_01_FULL_49_17]